MSSYRLILAIAVNLCAIGSASAQDWDGDGLDDGVESYLAAKFFPNNNMHCGPYDGAENGSKGQFYGSDIDVGSFGKLPFVAHPYVDSDPNSCGAAGSCIEIRYAMPYNWDLGDDQFGGSHRGDTEMVALLLKTDQDPSEASSSGDAWYAAKIYRTAHACASGESSSFQTLNSQLPPDNWVAEGKNGNYASADDCDNGGALSADICAAHRCWINRDYAVSKLENAGELAQHGLDGANGYIIPYPGEEPNYTPSGAYDVWGTESFGSAGTFCRHLVRALDWAGEQRHCEDTPQCGS